MTRNELAKAIAKSSGIKFAKAEKLIQAFGDTVQNTLKKGEKIVYSNFGTFYTVHYPSKTIFHPKLGAKKKMIMLPTNVAKWMPAINIKALANSGENIESPTLHHATKTLKVLAVKKKEDEREKPVKITVKDKITVNKKGSGSKKPDKVKDEIPVNLPTKAPDNYDDDIEKYEQEKQEREGKQNYSNIYEEILGDGSSEISTVKGTIKVHPDEKKPDSNIKDIDEKDNEEKEPKNEGEEVEFKGLKAVKPKVKKTAFKKSSGPFSILKEKFGIFGRKKKPDVATVETEEKEKDDNTKIPEDKARVSLAGAGIFSSKADNESTQPMSHGEQKIHRIKSEIKNGSPAPEDSLPQTPTPAPASKIEEDKAKALSTVAFDKVKITYKDLSKALVPKEILSRVPENIARKFRAVPFEEKDGVISIAMIDPEDIESKEMLKKLLGANVAVYLATEDDINHILAQYQGLESEVKSAIESAEDENVKEEKEEKGEKKDKKIEAETSDAPAAKIVESLLKRAIRDKASDVHIEPTENKVEVRFRLDGILKTKVELPKEIQAAVTSRIKILSNLKIDEQRVPQDGRFNMTVDQRRVDFRVSTMPIANGEKVVMRILDKESGILTIEQLGVSGPGLKAINENLKKSHGMVLVTGPTGSGKTTTLYAMIGKLYSEGVNIVTLEDPIEYQIKGINQSQVNSEIGYSFANGLRSILRQDPDIIMLGEIRDKETAEMAVHAALTGHVVLSTLHTNDAAGAAPRMIDMGVEPFLLTSSINVIIAQRLVREICPECKEEQKLPEEEIKKIKDEIERMTADEKKEIVNKDLKFYKGKGCKSCDNSGYKGRIGIYEVLNISEKINNLILKRVAAAEISNEAIAEGMVTMVQDGIIKALSGTTTMEEVWRVTKE